MEIPIKLEHLSTQRDLFGLNLMGQPLRWYEGAISELLTDWEKMWPEVNMLMPDENRPICDIFTVSAYIQIDFMFLFYPKINDFLWNLSTVCDFYISVVILSDSLVLSFLVWMALRVCKLLPTSNIWACKTIHMGTKSVQ